MGTKPGQQLMGQLERRAEVISGDFNSQDVANTLSLGVCDNEDKGRGANN